MLLLTSTSDAIQVAASSSNSLDIHCSYVDANAAGTITPGSFNTKVTTAGTTADISSSPSTGQRNVQTITVRNISTGSNDVTVKHSKPAATVECFKATLATLESLEFLDGLGFRVFDSIGAEKVTTPGAGRYLLTSVLQSTASATFTVGAQTNKIFTRQVGGGGGSAGATTGVAASGSFPSGGGSASYAEKTFDVTPNTGYTYQTGAGGTAGSSLGTAGGTGGNTTITVGAVTVTAFGGAGGTSMDTTLSTTAKIGGAGGAIPTNGDVNLPGDGGGIGYRSTGTFGWSGKGADSILGGGGGNRIALGNGSSGVGYGGGAGGPSVINGSTAVTGGTGAAGVILVDQYT